MTEEEQGTGLPALSETHTVVVTHIVTVFVVVGAVSNEVTVSVFVL